MVGPNSIRFPTKLQPAPYINILTSFISNFLVSSNKKRQKIYHLFSNLLLLIILQSSLFSQLKYTKFLLVVHVILSSNIQPSHCIYLRLKSACISMLIPLVMRTLHTWLETRYWMVASPLHFAWSFFNWPPSFLANSKTHTSSPTSKCGTDLFGFLAAILCSLLFFMAFHTVSPPSLLFEPSRESLCYNWNLVIFLLLGLNPTTSHPNLQILVFLAFATKKVHSALSCCYHNDHKPLSLYVQPPYAKPTFSLQHYLNALLRQ